MEKQAECRVRIIVVVVTCIDNRGAEGQLSIGSQYLAQGITRYGSDLYYKLRNDHGDLAEYGAHRFNTRESK